MASAKADGIFALIRKSTGGEVPARVRYEAESRRLVLMPEDDLKRGERYTARITAGTRDLVGNPLVAKSWSFTVRRQLRGGAGAQGIRQGRIPCLAYTRGRVPTWLPTQT